MYSLVLSGSIIASLIFFSRNIYQCLDIDEPVLMRDGSHRAIKNIQIGDEVVTFDPLTLDLSITHVIAHVITETDKRVVNITTDHGKQITATIDHKFMTPEGWKAPQHFEKATLLAVLDTDKGGVEFVAIREIQQVRRTMVADITTASNNHSFIGGRGQFLVHNSAMGKQAIAGQALNFHDQMDTKTHVLNYPQRPPVTTWTSELVGYDAEPAGQACVVAIMCFSWL